MYSNELAKLCALFPKWEANDEQFQVFENAFAKMQDKQALNAAIDEHYATNRYNSPKLFDITIGYKRAAINSAQQTASQNSGEPQSTGFWVCCKRNPDYRANSKLIEYEIRAKNVAAKTTEQWRQYAHNYKNYVASLERGSWVVEQREITPVKPDNVYRSAVHVQN